MVPEVQHSHLDESSFADFFAKDEHFVFVINDCELLHHFSGEYLLFRVNKLHCFDLVRVVPGNSALQAVGLRVHEPDLDLVLRVVAVPLHVEGIVHEAANHPQRQIIHIVIQLSFFDLLILLFLAYDLLLHSLHCLLFALVLEKEEAGQHAHLLSFLKQYALLEQMQRVGLRHVDRADFLNFEFERVAFDPRIEAQSQQAHKLLFLVLDDNVHVGFILALELHRTFGEAKEFVWAQTNLGLVVVGSQVCNH